MRAPSRFLDEIDTPALVVDLDVLEANIARMQAFFDGKAAALRPHAKTHKCPPIAHKQIAAGAVGITCAKVGEAEVLVASGIKDVLIANQVVGERKIRRLMGLVRHARITVAVDETSNVKALSAAGSAVGGTLGVLVEVDVGMGRCGVRPGRGAVGLACLVAKSKNLDFRGLQGYEGHVVLKDPGHEKDKATLSALAKLVRAKKALISAGIPCEEVSGGGTGTYRVTGAHPVMTEIQAGSYATMDARYSKVTPEFGRALFCAATVISRPKKSVVIADAGLKSLTAEFGMPEVAYPPGVSVAKLSEEHTHLRLTRRAAGIAVGEKILLVPSHGCTTINLHDFMFGVREGRLECRWSVAARGKAT